jgi:hypothetical protein
MHVIGKILILTLITVICLCIVTASAGEAPTVNFKGTVRYVAIEGGFWGLVSEDGKNYEPANLGQEFRHDGLAVQVAAAVINRPNINMWGTTIEVTAISRLENAK